jgi:hypothetical protein
VWLQKDRQDADGSADRALMAHGSIDRSGDGSADESARWVLTRMTT